MCIAGVLAATAIVGGTLAAFNTETRQAGVSQITTKSLGININQDGKTIVEQEETKEFVPGGFVSMPRNIVNDTADGYELYTRVTIYKSWDNDELDSSKINLYLNGTELIMANKAIIDQSDWILWYQDDEQVIMYYRLPVAAGRTTSEVLSGLTIDKTINNDYADATVDIEFAVDAVQAIAVNSAMVAEWGVYPTIDANGTIESISE